VYTSVSAFSKDFARVFSTEIGVDSVGNTAELQLQMAIRAPAQELTHEQKEKRKLAKRIIKAVQPSLEDAIRKESELNGKPFEKELKYLDLILENSVMSRRDSLGGTSEQGSSRSMPLPNGVDHTHTEDAMGIEDEPATVAPKQTASSGLNEQNNLRSLSKSTNQMDENAMDVDSAQANEQLHAEASFAPASPHDSGNLGPSSETPPALTNGLKVPKGVADGKGNNPLIPPTPPMSFEGENTLPPFQGGVPWYMEPFDPYGTTIYEERWTGREVIRGMSEELSDMDEDELDELVDVSQLPEADVPALRGVSAVVATNCGTGVGGAKKMKSGKQRRRWKGFK
jgi:NuA3 HAT complex component NTO1